MSFINLHVHDSMGSLLDSILTVDQIAQYAADNGQNAIAITNHGYMSSFVDFVKACRKRKVKPIIGCEVYTVHDQAEKADTREYSQPRYHLVLLAKNHDGLLNLFKIVSNACTEGFYKKPRTSLDIIEQNGWGKGIVCSTACQAGELSRLLTQGKRDEAWALFQRMQSIFDEAYVELQSHNTQSQQVANLYIAEFIAEHNLPYIITSDAHMLKASQLDTHSVFVAIGEGREVGESYEGCFLQNEQDVKKTLQDQFDNAFIQKGIEATQFLADSIEDIDIGLNSETHMPKIPIDGDHEQYLRDLVYQTFDEKFGSMSEEEQKKRRERIETELPVLYALHYTDYFIMLWMLAKEADRRGIPRGYSRGSGANCLCLFMLGVTQIDSVRWDLDFARFANLGRKSVADFDWDISKRRRKEMIEISEQLFGKESVAPIATFNTLSTKVAIRDIGKVLNERKESPYYNKIPYSVRDEVTKLIPTTKTLNDLGEEVEKESLLKDILDSNPRLMEIYQEFPKWFQYVMELEGLPKSMGRHAAGTLITPNPVIEYCPLCMDKEGNQMCQLEMHAAMDELSLVKMDYLGFEEKLVQVKTGNIGEPLT